uniref:helix-turn-helix domain-containing protein n=1 Tax=Enterocloster aldenensis TaxID=358742 RepID=UPI00140E23D8
MIGFSERTKEIGYKEGMQQGMQQATYDIILKMYKKGMSTNQIADITDITVDDINKILIDK